MRRLATLTTLAVLATVAVPAVAAALPAGPYRTDKQAARYVHRVRGGSVYCVNGYYSRHEQRTHRHFRQRYNGTSRSFTCSWVAPGRRSVQLYVVTRWGPWRIVRDR
jgi:hypothetical protein